MVPVQFEYEGKIHKGYLIPVAGVDSKTYHLMVSKTYYGSLSLVEDDSAHLTRDPATVKYKWRFFSQSGKLDHLESVFIEALSRVKKYP